MQRDLHQSGSHMSQPLLREDGPGFFLSFKIKLQMIEVQTRQWLESWRSVTSRRSWIQGLENSKSKKEPLKDFQTHFSWCVMINIWAISDDQDCLLKLKLCSWTVFFHLLTSRMSSIMLLIDHLIWFNQLRNRWASICSTLSLTFLY